MALCSDTPVSQPPCCHTRNSVFYSIRVSGSARLKGSPFSSRSITRSIKLTGAMVDWDFHMVIFLWAPRSSLHPAVNSTHGFATLDSCLRIGSREVSREHKKYGTPAAGPCGGDFSLAPRRTRSVAHHGYSSVSILVPLIVQKRECLCHACVRPPSRAFSEGVTPPPNSVALNLGELGAGK